MQIVTRDHLAQYFYEIRKSLEEGGIIIIPTDTVYGLACDARNADAILALKKLKKRYKPLAVLAPSMGWVEENCETSFADLTYLPGRYTIVLSETEPFLSVNRDHSLGVRIPDHWIAGFAKDLGFPLVLTSVNVAGMDPLTSIDDLEFEEYASFRECPFFIDDGVLKNTLSTVIDMRSQRPIYLRM